MILQKLKTDAEAYLGQPVTEAVITVPAYFTDSQRQATKDAGQIAGLNVKRIINEPTAAALSYGIDKEEDQRVMVYDLGGGTFDVSIIEMGDGVQEVLATAGNNHLGGDDFDKKIMDWLVAEFKKEQGIDLSGDKMAMQRIKEAAEKAKIELSSTTTTNINIPFIAVDANGGPKHLDINLTVAKFNELTKDLVDATMGPVQQALSDSGLSPSELNKVLMVGGSSRIPAATSRTVCCCWMLHRCRWVWKPWAVFAPRSLRETLPSRPRRARSSPPLRITSLPLISLSFRVSVSSHGITSSWAPSVWTA